MSYTENYFRSFGMSGYLITEDINLIEKQYNIELGHVTKSDKEDPVDYYPQFEKVVRQEASEMAKHYELFYCLEKAIRKLISETLAESNGSNWWNSEVIPQAIMESVKKNVDKEKDSGVTMRSEASIDYTNFGELSVIITSNWTLFDPIFTSRLAVQKIMQSLNVLRAPIAHCCPLQQDEIIRLHLAVKDWFRILG